MGGNRSPHFQSCTLSAVPFLFLTNHHCLTGSFEKLMSSMDLSLQWKNASGHTHPVDFHIISEYADSKHELQFKESCSIALSFEIVLMDGYVGYAKVSQGYACILRCVYMW